jgi:3D-(3,5/4)-trihydroxycyclohexane-1,2-dione acylhydrolase (decyclizing)
VGFASIGGLSETVGVPRFGTRYRYRDPRTGRLDRGVLPVDLAANAESLGVRVLRTRTIEELADALLVAKDEAGPVLVHIETDPLVPAPSSDAWWDVPVAEISTLDETRAARVADEKAKTAQRPHVGTETVLVRERDPGRRRRGR